MSANVFLVVRINKTRRVFSNRRREHELRLLHLRNTFSEKNAICAFKGHWQRKFLSRNLEVLTHLRLNIILISCQTLLFKSYSHINAPKF